MGNSDLAWQAIAQLVGNLVVWALIIGGLLWAFTAAFDRIGNL